MSPDHLRDDLRDQLRLDDRATLLVDALTPTEAGVLSEHTTATRRRRTADLDRQIDAILGKVPRIIRSRAPAILKGNR